MHEKFIPYLWLMGSTRGYLLPASRSSMQLSSFFPAATRAALIPLPPIIEIACSENSFVASAAAAASPEPSSGTHLSTFIKSATAFATPIPPMLAYAGSVFDIFAEYGLPPPLLNLTVTRCPMVGETFTDVRGSENPTLSSISLDMASESAGSMCLPALLSVMTLSPPLLSSVAKFPRKARSPSAKSIPMPIASITPRPA